MKKMQLDRSAFKKASILFLTMLISCQFLCACSQEKKSFQGYVDSKLRYISSNYTGLLLKLYVREGDKVNKGQSLFMLEPSPEQWDIDKAISQLNADKNLVQELQLRTDIAKDKLKRREQLERKKFASQEELDNARSEYSNLTQLLDEAKATLSNSQAAWQKAVWAKGKKNIVSPANATVYDLFYYENELVPAERPVLSLLIPEDLKIIFFVPEKMISSLAVGQTVIVNCDGCQQFNAKISFISLKTEFTPPIIFSEQTREKLVFSVEAKAEPNTNTWLHPGQPVTVSLSDHLRE